MTYILSLEARQDIKSILTYTLETWGYQQLQKYETQLEQIFLKLASKPDLLGHKKRDDLFAGCRSYSVGKHTIFYQQSNECIEIARILHQSMDHSRHFDE